MRCRGHRHPRLPSPIATERFLEEFAVLARRAGIADTCAIELSERMRKIHERKPRRYAEVDADGLHFHFAPQVLWLPEENRRGLIAHEIGHVLCRDLPDGGTEDDADEAARRAMGVAISYDGRWPGRGLQSALGRNPPYSGWREGWWRQPVPRADRVCYRTKTEALNKFLEANWRLVEAWGGPNRRDAPTEFEALNHRYGLRGDRQVDTIARAAWWALGGPGPWCLENINLDLLNETGPARHAERELGESFRLPDYAEEARHMAQWEAEYPEHEEVPF